MGFIKENRNILTVFIISIIYTVILLNKIIFSSGYILFLDYFFPIYPDRFLDYHIEIWNSISSMTGIESIPTLFARIPFLILAHFGIDVGTIEKLMYISLYIIGIFSAYFFLRKVINLGHLSSLFLSLSFVTFMHFFRQSFLYSAVWGGMIFPAIFSLFYLGINNKKAVYVIIAGILVVTTLQMPFTFFMINILVISYMIYVFIFSRDISILTHYIIFVVIQIFIGSFYFLPFLVISPSPEYMTYNIVTYEEVASYSKRYYIDPLIGFPSAVRFSGALYSDTILYRLQFLVSIILQVILPLSALVLAVIREKINISKLTIFFVMLWFCLWQLALGDIGLLGDLYTSVITEHSILNFMRAPVRFYVFIPFVVIGLLGILFKSIKRERLQTSFSIIFLISIIFVSFPSIIFWNNNLKSIQIPEEFGDVQKIVEKDIQTNNNYFRTMWYPEYLESKTAWSSYSNVSRMILPFEQRSSKIPIYSYSRSGYRQNLIFNDFIWNLLSQNSVRLASDYLNQYRIKYIIFHDDIEEDNEKKNINRGVLNNLLSSKDFELKYHKGFMYLFENKNFENGGYINIDQNIPILLESFNLQGAVQYAGVDRDYLLLDDGYKGMWNIFTLSKNIVMINYSNYADNLIYYKFYDNYYSPGKNNFHGNDKEYWSVKSGWEINPQFDRYIRTYIYKNFNGHALDFEQRIIATVGENVTVTYDVDVNKSGKYILMIRSFENMRGGDLEFQLDRKSYVFNTSGETNRFAWKKFDNIYLEKGHYNISLKNINGYNAINVFGLIPEEGYYITKDEIENAINDKSVYYILETELDMYRESASVNRNKDTSNGEELIFGQGGKVWQNIEIVKKGNYIVDLRGMGKFKTTIGNKSFIIESDSLSSKYSPTLYLDVGNYNLEILSLNTNDTNISEDFRLDVIWIYSSKDDNIDYIFDNKDIKGNRIKLLNYTNIGSATWKIRTNVTSPFMLSIAESYDPQWKATIYKDGKKVRDVGAIPLYSIIDGFWIDDIGDIEIIVKYGPQYWYNIGLIISMFTVICCIGYIFYDWRKR